MPMLQSFLNFCLDVFSGIIEILQYTDIGGVTLEDVLVAVILIVLVVRIVIVRFGE